MSDPTELQAQIEAAADSFSHAHGQPQFEPGLNASADAADGEVQIQKACRLLEMMREITDSGDYYGATLEHSFIVIEQTFQGYLLAVTGVDAHELRNHTSPYEFAKGQVPIDDDTIEAIQRLYDARRTDHYYGTTVTTKTQAEMMRNVAQTVHRRIVGFDPQLSRLCNCPPRD